MRPKAKYAVIHRHRDEYPVSVMCKFFGVSRSGYYVFDEADRQSRTRVPALARKIGECQDKDRQNIRLQTDLEVAERSKYREEPENCAESYEKVWFVIRDPPPKEVGQPRPAGT